MRQLEAHLAVFVAADSDALVLTAPRAGRRARSLFQSPGQQPSREGGLDSRRSRSAACGRALWPSWWSRAATCVRCRNGRDNNVAFTLTRYGSLLEDGSDGVYLPAARVERG
jgi:hypothetical protein